MPSLWTQSYCACGLFAKSCEINFPVCSRVRPDTRFTHSFSHVNHYRLHTSMHASKRTLLSDPSSLFQFWRLYIHTCTNSSSRIVHGPWSRKKWHKVYGTLILRPYIICLTSVIYGFSAKYSERNRLHDEDQPWCVWIWQLNKHNYSKTIL